LTPTPTVTPTPTLAVSPDFNGNGYVDFEDVMTAVDAWAGGVYDPAHDVNGDGKNDVLDVQLVTARWGT